MSVERRELHSNNAHHARPLQCNEVTQMKASNFDDTMNIDVKQAKAQRKPGTHATQLNHQLRCSEEWTVELK